MIVFFAGGRFYDIFPLRGLTSENFSELENSDLWVSNTQLITVWPSDPDAKLVGEDIYFGEDPMKTLTPINRDEIPENKCPIPMNWVFKINNNDIYISMLVSMGFRQVQGIYYIE